MVYNVSMAKYMHTEEDYIKAVSESFSIAEVCRSLGILAKGGNYDTVKRNIIGYNLDISHMSNTAWNNGEYLAKKIFNPTLRKELIEIRGYQCEECLGTSWMDSPIPLELEHIDGNNTNVDHSNLMLLCCNCHGLTATFTTSKKIVNAVGEVKIDKTICKCGKIKSRSAEICGQCAVQVSLSGITQKDLNVKYANKGYSKSDFIKAVSESSSYAEVCRKVGLSLKTGSSTKRVRTEIVKYNLDASHMKGQGIHAGVLFDNSKTKKSLKLRIIRDRGYQCEEKECALENWNGRAVPIELEHIDGDSKNNDLGNLKLLCRNCHAITKTYRRKKSSLIDNCTKCIGSKKCNECWFEKPFEFIRINGIWKKSKHSKLNSALVKFKKPRKNSQPRKKNLCPDCGNSKSSKSIQCRKCSNRDRIRVVKIEWPEVSILVGMLSESNFVQISKQLGVSDNAIRRHLKHRGINPKTLEPLELQD